MKGKCYHSKFGLYAIRNFDLPSSIKESLRRRIDSACDWLFLKQRHGRWCLCKLSLVIFPYLEFLKWLLQVNRRSLHGTNLGRMLFGFDRNGLSLLQAWHGSLLFPHVHYALAGTIHSRHFAVLGRIFFVVLI